MILQSIGKNTMIVLPYKVNVMKLSPIIKIYKT